VFSFTRLLKGFKLDYNDEETFILKGQLNFLRWRPLKIIEKNILYLQIKRTFYNLQGKTFKCAYLPVFLSAEFNITYLLFILASSSPLVICLIQHRPQTTATYRFALRIKRHSKDPMSILIFLSFSRCYWDII
jgi:hypothetical protein